MNKEYIMDYKIYLYFICTLLSVFALSGVNFDKIMKKNKIWEARVLVLVLSLALGYILTNFITAFI